MAMPTTHPIKSTKAPNLINVLIPLLIIILLL